MLRTFLTTTVLAGFAATSALADAALLGKTWDEIVAEAKEEGQVTWFNWYFEPEFREAVKPFEAEYGIKVNIPDVNSGDDVLNKLMAEKDLAQTDIDLMSLGGAAGFKVTPSDLFMGPITAVLPEGASLNPVVEGADWGGSGAQFWGNQTCLAYDPDRVSADDLPNSVDDLVAWMAANPGQFGFNFEQGGSGPSFIHNVARNILGITKDATLSETPDLQPVFDWFIANEDNYILTASNADSLSRFNSGEFTMIATWEDFLAGNINRGEVSDRFKCYVPDFGMNGGGNVVAVPKNAANPAAALVLAHWLSAAATQTAFNQSFGTAPANAGADGSSALVPIDDRANRTNWGAPLASGDVVPAVIENVFQR
jgi:putative spermidine/putrescine transport system substrate-binding protein